MKKTFSGIRSVFIEGEIVIFKGASYSHYDDCDFYQFESEGDGAPKSFGPYCGPWQEVLEWRNPLTTPPAT